MKRCFEKRGGFAEFVLDARICAVPMRLASMMGLRCFFMLEGYLNGHHLCAV